MRGLPDMTLEIPIKHPKGCSKSDRNGREPRRVHLPYAVVTDIFMSIYI